MPPTSLIMHGVRKCGGQNRLYDYTHNQSKLISDVHLHVLRRVRENPPYFRLAQPIATAGREPVCVENLQSE